MMEKNKPIEQLIQELVDKRQRSADLENNVADLELTKEAIELRLFCNACIIQTAFEGIILSNNGYITHINDWRQLEILFGDNYFSRFSP